MCNASFISLSSLCALGVSAVELTGGDESTAAQSIRAATKKSPAKAQSRKATSRAYRSHSPTFRLCDLAGNFLSKTKLGKLATLVALVLACSFITISQAQIKQPPSNDPVDPAVEQRLAKLSQELRCLVCQNETLADSRADLAEDLRREIREQIRAGKSDQEIIAFLTQRYGEFILYRPPVKPKTYLLWFGPFVLLLVGLVILFRYVKRRRDLIPEQPLSNADHQRATELLGSSSGKETA